MNAEEANKIAQNKRKAMVAETIKSAEFKDILDLIRIQAEKGGFVITIMYKRPIVEALSFMGYKIECGRKGLTEISW